MLQKIGYMKDHLVIFDARPKMNASGNRVKGGGFEDMKYYPNTSLVFCGIDNIHAVSFSHNSMVSIAANPDNFKSIGQYGPEIE